jgi:molecular chaperone GrpE
MNKQNKGHFDGGDTQARPATQEHGAAIELNPADEVVLSDAVPPGDEGTVAALKAQIEEKDKEIAELKDRYLRSLADSENARKRIRQQSEESVRYQRENLLRDLLPIVDNLERAVDAAQGGGGGGSIVEGVQMVLASLLDYLRVQGVTPIDARGRMFDPRLHEAVDHVESPQHEPNTVVSEMHRGYQAGDRILRPARVSVAKGGKRDSETAETAKDSGEDGK